MHGPTTIRDGGDKDESSGENNGGLIERRRGKRGERGEYESTCLDLIPFRRNWITWRKSEVGALALLRINSADHAESSFVSEDEARGEAYPK